MPEKPAYNFRIDQDLHSRFKAKCVMDRVKMSDVVEKLLEDYVEEKETVKSEEIQETRTGD